MFFWKQTCPIDIVHTCPYIVKQAEAAKHHYLDACESTRPCVPPSWCGGLFFLLLAAIGMVLAVAGGSGCLFV